jgi:hypothetical protein
LILFTSIYLKSIGLPAVVMIANRTILAAVFTIAIASSLIAVSSLVGSAHALAAKKSEYGTAPTVALTRDKPYLAKSQKAHANQPPSLALGSPDAVSVKELKSLSKCQSGAAADGGLTLAEIKSCYHKVF